MDKKHSIWCLQTYKIKASLTKTLFYLAASVVSYLKAQLEAGIEILQLIGEKQKLENPIW